MEDIIFAIRTDSDTGSDVKKLNEYLSSIGIKVSVNKSSNSNQTYINFNINESRFISATKRNAGRHTAFNHTSIKYTYGDLDEWRKQGKSHKEIANLLEMSEATYYRRLKQSKDFHHNSTDRLF